LLVFFLFAMWRSLPLSLRKAEEPCPCRHGREKLKTKSRN
jgi:hypothetical protein